jgi:hypothetical protein
MIMILGISIMGLCVLCVIAMVIYSKSGGSTTAGSVIKDVTSGLFSGTAAGILDIGKQFGAAFDADNQACKSKYADKISSPGDNIFSDNKLCYMCKNGHQDRTIYGVTTEGACEGSIDKLKAARVSEGILKSTDVIGMDHLAALAYFCPDKSGRTLDPVTSPTACMGSCGDLYPESFEDWTTGNCYSCDGGDRNWNLSGSGKECTTKDGSVKPWVKVGTTHIPVKWKESTLEPAVYLGKL